MHGGKSGGLLTCLETQQQAPILKVSGGGCSKLLHLFAAPLATGLWHVTPRWAVDMLSGLTATRHPVAKPVKLDLPARSTVRVNTA